MPDPLRVRVSGPLAPYAAGYAAELARVGYTASGATLSLRLVAHLSVWLEREGLEAGALSAAQVDRFLAVRQAAGHTRYASIRAIRPPLEYLRGLGVVPAAPEIEPDAPVDRLLARYRRYLVVERSLAPTMAAGYFAAVRPFLAGRATPDGLALEGLTIADVTSFVVTHCPSQPRGSAKLTVTSLRSLLGFLHLEGVLPRSLAASVPRTAAWRLAPLPRGLTRAEVERLLAACDRSRATGRRDFAILTLLVRLGPRAGEVAGLTLDAIDWRAGELVVSATVAVLRVWLAERAGEAADPLFPTSTGTPLSRDAVERRITRYAASAATACPSLRTKRISPHILRHTAAMRLLQAGVDTSVIALWLGHEHVDTTQIYLHADLALKERALARTTPPGTKPGRYRPSDTLLAFLDGL